MIDVTFTKAQISSEVLWLLVETTAGLSATTNLEELQQLLSQRLRWLFDYDRCVLAVRTESDGETFRLLEISMDSSQSSSRHEELEYPLGDNWPGRVLLNAIPYFVDDAADLPPADNREAVLRKPLEPNWGVCPKARSLMLLPLRSGNNVIGCLLFSSVEPYAYSLAWRNLGSMLALHLGGQLGLLLTYHKKTTTLKKQLKARTVLDSVTGLPNRKQFEYLLQQMLEQQDHAAKGMAVVIAELEQFNLINSALGHSNGDYLSRQVAQLLQTFIYPSDIVARLQDDKFGLVLNGIKDAVSAKRIAGELAEKLNQPVSVAGQNVLVEAKVGVTFYSALAYNQIPTAGELLRQANSVLDHLKREKVSKYELFSPERDNWSYRLSLQTELRLGLDREEFYLRYQPQVETCSGRVLGAEALLRWTHPSLGVVSPARFIPVAEETGLIVPLGTRVLKEACRQKKRNGWASSSFKLCVNVSAIQLAQPNFVELVGACLQEYQIGAHELELELTESIFIGDSQENVRKLAQLRAMGIEIALDDFGTGYSSLSYLSRLPIDTLKLDQSFIRGTDSAGYPQQALSETNQNQRTIIETIIGMVHRLGMKVVAEGVETQAQFDFLRNAGCDIIQGYLISAPLDAGDFENKFIILDRS
ncbi:MAG TPA: GGDEF domain-containing protein [Chloroflexia bacterium]|nr:GGDEF domain-containing protein [Chloroflexia bacterium]